jgi:heptosyltransferase-2
MTEILLIKLGSMGDVLRTSPLHPVVDGNVCWVSRGSNQTLLPRSWNFIQFSDSKDFLNGRRFDLVLSLDEDPAAADLASTVGSQDLIGTFMDAQNRVSYTDSSRGWFDMGLVSRLGLEKANSLKFANSRSYQEILFEMLGKKFDGEEYAINTSNLDLAAPKGELIVGLEPRAASRWPTKRWNRYQELADALENDGIPCKQFAHRDSLVDYIKDISECTIVVTGDTLTLHVALALKIFVIAIFTCTSPSEIFDYRRMEKIVSPLLKKSFYSTDLISEAVEAIALDEVYGAVVRSVERIQGSAIRLHR